MSQHPAMVALAQAANPELAVAVQVLVERGKASWAPDPSREGCWGLVPASGDERAAFGRGRALLVVWEADGDDLADFEYDFEALSALLETEGMGVVI